MKNFSDILKRFKISHSNLDGKQNDYSFSLVFDTRGGQPIGKYDVRIDSKNIIFDYYENGKINRHNSEGSQDYITLASLVTPVKRSNKDYYSTRVTPDSLCYFYSTDIDYEYVSDEKLFEVATKLGPLFGRYGVQKNNPRVIESKESWYFAAKVISFCLRAEGVLYNPKENLGSVDDDLFYHSAIFESGGYQLIVSKTFGDELPEPYRSMLLLNDEQMSSMADPRTFADNAFSRAFWIGPNFGKIDKNVLFLILYQGLNFSGKQEYSRLSGQKLREMFELQNKLLGGYDSETDLTAEESIIESLTQALIYIHVAKVKLNWGVVEDYDGSTSASLDFCFDNYLQRIWYELGQAHSKKIIRICEQCGGPFVAENNTNVPQRFCSESCQIKAKKIRQKKREKAIADLVKELKRDFSFSDEEAFRQYVAKKMRPYYHSDSDLNKQLDSLAEKILTRVKRK